MRTDVPFVDASAVEWRDGVPGMQQVGASWEPVVQLPDGRFVQRKEYQAGQ
jgi:hypothetical protein